MRGVLVGSLLLCLVLYIQFTEYEKEDTYCAVAYSAARDVMIMLMVGDPPPLNCYYVELLDTQKY